MTKQKIWFITGVSKGLGRILAEQVAKNGDIAIGSLRNENELGSYKDLVPNFTFAVLMDVTNHLQIDNVFDEIISKFGKIDVLVNNAGFGFMGAIEELSMAEIKNQFDTNVFGAMYITQKVLPSMRQNKFGYILQLSSMAGFRSAPGVGLYNASKYALEGFSEALFHEVKSLGIRVVIIEPGPFRTEFAGTSLKVAQNRIKDYDSTTHLRIDQILEGSGKQIGDPFKAVKLIIRSVDADNPPLRLVLGKIAINAIRLKLKEVEQDILVWEELSVQTDYDN
ncbi:MAG: oxidoreductase [Candidatus Kapabacteria bacterium]|nr:oxidoreductase [Candidatus Kapabacteria bacterium]